ncbi:MAG: Uma2 family endonuclease [Chloroflexi bacterium]|nr:Uma2 family endonuclease [Chloroflexota bacterium]MCI0643287.1 Uma2 family endonuclease [Chloroflexota bacterium]MCI0731674.1 Uma2 family endonuclease [Chloroflexota bacterium]
MAETEFHLNQMVDALLHPLKEKYHDDPGVTVSGNMFLYFEEGNPAKVVAPDVFIVFGVSKKTRRVYKVWEEGKAPDVVFEITSRSTLQDDLGRKRVLYQELGVQEYFLFDPLHEYLRPPLQGYRLLDEYYVPLMPEQASQDEWRLTSQVLGLALHASGLTLRLYDPAAARYLLTRPEEAEARRAAEEGRRAAEEALRQAQAEIARLKALLDKK